MSRPSLSWCRPPYPPQPRLRGNAFFLAVVGWMVIAGGSAGYLAATIYLLINGRVGT